MRREIRHRFAALVLGISFSAALGILTYGAEGTWTDNAQGRQYITEEGQTAKNCWLDIEGEWYHFDQNGIMETGWKKIGNLRYHFEDDGTLSYGWQKYDGDGKETWYFYDKSGNAVIRWLYDEGKWYWFNGNGTLSTESVKTIGGKKYYFHEDGSLRANEYEKFRYFNSDGELDSSGDVRAEKSNGKTVKVDEATREEIALKLNALPKGWLCRFIKTGWTFVYCPEDEYYSAARDEKNGDRYYIRYKIDPVEKTLRFAEPEAVTKGFGEYVYSEGKKIFRDLGLSAQLRGYQHEIFRLTELPEYYEDDYGVMFGALFEKYLDESEGKRMADELEGVWWVMNQGIQRMGLDGQFEEQ